MIFGRRVKGNWKGLVHQLREKVRTIKMEPKRVRES